MENLIQIKMQLTTSEYSAFIVKAGALGLTPNDFLRQLITDLMHCENAGTQYCHEVLEDYYESFSLIEPSLVQHICRQLDTDEIDKIDELIKSKEIIVSDENELAEIKGFVEKLDPDYTQEDIDDAQECLNNDQNYYDFLRKQYGIEWFCQKNNLDEQSEMEKLKKWYFDVFQFAMIAKDESKKIEG